MECPTSTSTTMSNITNTSTTVTPTPTSLQTDQVVKVVVLVLVLTELLISNLLVILRVTRSGGGCRGSSSRWSASDKLIRTLCVLGMLTGLLNIPAYLLTICSGRWVLGDTICLFQGFLGSVLIDSWHWILAVAAFERYLKLLQPSEHRCFFSEVNTKILMWGAILLLSVIYMGPVYGWGEYTIFRGKLDLIISISSNSTQLSPEGLSSVIMYLGSLTISENPVAMETMKNLTSFFTEDRQIYIRKPHFDPLAAGVVLPLRVSTRAALQCLWSEFEAGSLVTSLQEVVASNLSLQELGIPGFDVSATISKEKYLLYNDVHIPFQEGATCSLDYSDVNEHVYSFIAFSWCANMAAPLVLMCYCYGHLSCSHVNKVRALSSDQTMAEDAIWTPVCAKAGFTSLLCGVPFGVASVLAGRGIYVPTSVHFAMTVLVYFSPSLLPLFYLNALHNQWLDYSDDVGEQRRCCFTNCFSLYHQQVDLFTEFRQSLLSIPRMSCSRHSVSFTSPSTRVSLSSGTDMCTTLAYIEETEI